MAYSGDLFAQGEKAEAAALSPSQSEMERSRAPLAERMRPQRLDQVLGQEEAIGPNSAFGQILRSEELAIPSVLLWGPPGVGKTTLAQVIANTGRYHFVRLSGVLDGVAELRQVVKDAEVLRKKTGQSTLALVDEIHRFNKSQQDAFLPHVESGLLTLIGQTTENVSFRIRNALLSRMRVVALKPLTDEVIAELLQRAILDSVTGLGAWKLTLHQDAALYLARLSMGDARRALTGLEWAAATVRSEAHNRTGQPGEITRAIIETSFGTQPSYFDQDGDAHYDCISAFIKSLRGSDPDAALYYMVRALDSGEDPLFLTRRMIVFASEDASCDPRALQVAVDCDRAVERVGLPEGKISMAQAAVYLACTSKSNRSYLALKEMEQIVKQHPDLPIPPRLRNAPTELMKEMGNSAGYRYPHDYPGGFVPERYLPDAIAHLEVYSPSDRGLDIQIAERLAQYRSRAREERK